MKLQKAIPKPLDGHKYVNGHEFNYKLRHGGVTAKTVRLAYDYAKIILFEKRGTAYHFIGWFNWLRKIGEVKQTEDHKKWIRVVKKPKNINPLF